jgi:hypothetical protein
MSMFGRRRLSPVLGLIAVVMVCYFAFRPSGITRRMGSTLMGHETPTTPLSVVLDGTSPSSSHLAPQLHDYFDQILAPKPFEGMRLSNLKYTCEHTEWRDDMYLNCLGINQGITSVMSQLKVCFKMAIDAGVNLMLPTMALRDSANLTNYNFMDESGHYPYKDWFDVEHLVQNMGAACPQMQIVEGKAPEPVRYTLDVDIDQDPAFQPFRGVFWPGHPFRPFFDQQVARKIVEWEGRKLIPVPEKGSTTVNIMPAFNSYKVTDDPTGDSLRIWYELGHLIRFKEVTRNIVASLMGKLAGGPFIGIHFRVEADATNWAPIDQQIERTLFAANRAWKEYGWSQNGARKVIYLACGDQGQIAKFVEAAKGWHVVDKWSVAKDWPAQTAKDITDAINGLPFDHQGTVDFGVMLKSSFFIGVMGSAFSYTIANSRDPLSRYRGSSFDIQSTGAKQAASHLFEDNEALAYSCCL